MVLGLCENPTPDRHPPSSKFPARSEKHLTRRHRTCYGLAEMNPTPSIKELRIARNMTRAALAEAIGVSPSYVTYIETGRRDPRISVVFSIAAALGVDWSRLYSAPAGDSGRGRRPAARPTRGCKSPLSSRSRGRATPAPPEG